MAAINTTRPTYPTATSLAFVSAWVIDAIRFSHPDVPR